MMFDSTRFSFLCWKSSESNFLLLFFFGIANSHSIERIKDCGITCSQGVHCKYKPTHDMLNLFCRTAPQSLTPNILEHMRISTVMKCPPAARCSLHLNITGTVNLDVHIRGVEICTMSMSTQQNQCMHIRFTKSKAKKHEHKVHVEANCFEVGVSEHVFVTMKTVPDYCGTEISKDYHVQDCHNKDLGKNILPCLTGKLDYMVNEDKKSIIVYVSNIPKDYDYNVRLCLKHISCHDTGAHALIKKDNTTKSVTLKYSEIVPCLCIEGWLLFPDSRRTRLCPFKNDLDNLWDRITYNPRTRDLAWKSVCPVDATVNLCRMKEEKCVNIPNSANVKKDQALYYQVDTQPKLCMKFTTEKGAWVRCPFVSGAFAAWQMKTVFTDEVIQIRFMFSAKADFSVFICNRTKHNSCGSIQRHALVYMGASGYASLNLTRDLCGRNMCIQVLRVDVNYSFPVLICHIPCKSNQKKL
ncbi:interleukin-17 receptor E-like protein isoform 3-T3 [Anomaloglossus baeobatrachus]